MHLSLVPHPNPRPPAKKNKHLFSYCTLGTYCVSGLVGAGNTAVNRTETRSQWTFTVATSIRMVS